MPVGNWWLVDDRVMKIMAGPFLWDGVTRWDPPPDQRPVNTNPINSGYTWMTDQPAPSLTDLQNRVAALEARVLAEARGVATVPAIASALGGNVTPRVKLRTAVRGPDGKPTTSYAPSAFLIPGPGITLLSTVKITTVAVVDAQNVDVTINSSGALTLGSASVIVFADAN